MSLKAILLAMAIARGADTGTSLVVFHQGGTETNPLVVSQQPLAFAAQMAAETAFQTWLVRRLDHHHPRWARTIAFAQIGASAWATTGNIRQMKGSR